MKRIYQIPQIEQIKIAGNTTILKDSSPSEGPFIEGGEGEGAAKDHKYNIWQNWDEFDDDKKTRDHVFDRSLF